MANYSYQAINESNGNIKSGTVEAKNKQDAIRKIEAENLSVFELEAENQIEGETGSGFSLFFNKQANLILFTNQMANLLKSGIRLGEALKIVSRLVKDNNFRKIIDQVHQSLIGGKGFAESLAEHPQYFSSSYVNMIKAGEEGGFLALTCQRLANNLEENSELKSFIISSLIYPVILLLVAIIAIVVMIIFVLPNFSSIYENYGTKLPKTTQLLLDSSDFLVNYWWIIILSIVGLVITIVSYYQSASGKKKIDSYLLEFPILGNFIISISIARLCKSIGSMLESGVPLLKSIRMSKNITSNVILQQGLAEAARKVKRGSHLSEALDKVNVFPEVVTYMIGIGEETGQLSNMLLEISENYEQDSKKTLEKFMKIFEPVVILIMGVSIGFIIISMLLPILGINNISF